MATAPTRPLPESMRACVYRTPRTLEVEDRPVPAPGPEELLLEVSHCGVCGTDLHLVMEGWGRPDSIGGHEYSGVVVAVGEGATGFAPGDRVVGGPAPGCGACEHCRAHRPGLCTSRSDFEGGEPFQGAFAEYKRVRADAVVRIPGALGLREAALAEPLAVALHGITLSGIREGQRALVTGAGPIGALVLAALRARGIEDVRVSEPGPARRALAKELGASRVEGPDALAVPAMPFTLVDDPVHHVFECSGRPEAIEAGLAQLGRAGTLVLLGTGMDRPKLDAVRMILNELTVVGSYNYDEDGFADALELLASGGLPTDRLIDARDVPLTGLGEAMERLVDGTIAGKVLVAPHTG